MLVLVSTYFIVMFLSLTPRCVGTFDMTDDVCCQCFMQNRIASFSSRWITKILNRLELVYLLIHMIDLCHISVKSKVIAIFHDC